MDKTQAAAPYYCFILSNGEFLSSSSIRGSPLPSYISFNYSYYFNKIESSFMSSVMYSVKQYAVLLVLSKTCFRGQGCKILFPFLGGKMAMAKIP